MTTKICKKCGEPIGNKKGIQFCKTCNIEYQNWKQREMTRIVNLTINLEIVNITE